MKKDIFKAWDFSSIISVIGIVLIILVVVLVVFFRSTPTEDVPFGLSGGVISGSILQYVTSSSGETLHTGALFLHRVVVGADVTNALISIIDATTSSGQSVFFQISGNSLQGVYEIGANLSTGIWVTVSGQNNATFIFTPTE